MTNRTDIQPALLGTGRGITARLFTADEFSAEHNTTLSVTDSDGNISSDTVRINIWTLV